MKILVQWARQTPQGWEEVDSSSWSGLPKKPDLTGQPPGVGVDNQPGLVAQLNVQGINPGADHYAVETVDQETLRLTVWNDSDPTALKEAYVWTIKTLAPDPVHGGAINTRQRPVVYAEGDLSRFTDNGWPEAHPWPEFVEPPQSITRHGRWLSDAHWQRHLKVAPLKGWRDFTEGLPPSEVIDGRIPNQRNHHSGQQRYLKPDGTKTLYGSDTALATGVHAATNEVEMKPSTGTQANLSAAVSKGASVLIDCFTSTVGWPNDADWPSGTYGCVLDVTANAYSSVGLRTVGTVTGHFARVDSGLTSDLQSWAQTEAAFTGTGLKTATTGTIDPTAGSASDRYECLVGGYNSSGSMNDTVTLQVNESDDQMYGPWAGNLSVSVTETAIEVSDSVTGVCSRILTVSISETAIEVSDSVSRVGTLARPVSEVAIDVTDSTSRWTNLVRQPALDEPVVSDSVDAQKTVSGQLFEREASDTVDALADGAAGTSDCTRQVSETEITVTDAATGALDALRAPTDTVGATTDSVAREHVSSRVTVDTVDDPSDAVAVQLLCSFARVAADTVDEITDVCARTSEAGRVASDTVADTADSATASMWCVYARTASDSVDEVTDSAARAHEALRAASDDVADVADSATGQVLRVHERSAGDDIAVDDAASRATDTQRVASDTVEASDAVVLATAFVYSRSAGDTVDVGDTVTGLKSGTSEVSVNDTPDVEDTPARSVTFERRIDDWKGLSYP